MATRRQQTNRESSRIDGAKSRIKSDVQNAHIPQSVGEAKGMAWDAATSKWMERLARLGYAVKGVVYLIIGLLAAQLAVGIGGKVTDQKGAIQTISSLPFGKVLLVIVGIGLVGFALWSFIQAIFDTEGKGKDAKGIVGRIGYAAVGVSYSLFALAAFQLALGTASASNQKSSTASTQDVTAQLLKQPFGVALVVFIGLVVLGVAAYLFYKAYSAKFQYRFKLAELPAHMKKWVIYMGRLGYSAIGVVMLIVGIFLMVAAFQHNASKAKGLDGALLELTYQPFGKLLLAIVALGLVAYGIYSFFEARYRRVGK